MIIESVYMPYPTLSSASREERNISTFWLLQTLRKFLMNVRKEQILLLQAEERAEALPYRPMCLGKGLPTVFSGGWRSAQNVLYPCTVGKPSTLPTPRERWQRRLLATFPNAIATGSQGIHLWPLAGSLGGGGGSSLH